MQKVRTFRVKANRTIIIADDHFGLFILANEVHECHTWKSSTNGWTMSGISISRNDITFIEPNLIVTHEDKDKLRKCNYNIGPNVNVLLFVYAANLVRGVWRLSSNKSSQMVDDYDLFRLEVRTLFLDYCARNARPGYGA